MAKEKIHFRFAEERDTDLYYRWANDPLVRSNSYHQEKVAYETHVSWFRAKLSSPDCYFYLFENEAGVPVGQVRIMRGKETVIGISIDENFRGKSLGTEMLTLASNDYLLKNKNETIVAYIKTENAASHSIFKKAGFANETIVTEHGCESYKLMKH